VNVPLIGVSPILVNDAIKIAGKAYTDLPGVYSLQNLDQTKDSTKSFIADYKAKFGDADLTEQPAQTFDAINVLVEALKSDGGEGGQKLVDTLNSIKPYGGVSGKSGSQIEFSKDRHDGFKGKYLVTYKMKGPKAEQVNLGG
jgi:branched-chain amino acid transport system substrate-binding protein